MGGAWAEWTLRRSEEPFSGALVDAGLVFRDRPEDSYLEPPPARFILTGESALDGQGELALDQAVSLEGARGPQRFTLEADVADKSFRHVAGRTSLVTHPAEKYAGVKLGSDYLELGDDLAVELGVIDQRGKAIAGERVAARLVRVEWRVQKQRGPGGSIEERWQRVETEQARCSALSEPGPVSCTLKVPRAGDYRVIASVGGHDGGARTLWAYGDGAGTLGKAPSDGRVAQVSTDKAIYAPGDSARVVVRSPFAKATAILTVELGGLLSHQAKRVEGPAAFFDVPIDARFAPQVHVTATLLPIGATGAERAAFRVGAATLPVKLSGTELEVAVASDQASYRPGDTAEVSITVTDGGAAEAHAEVALAIVDEGVLRLTDHRPPDVTAALRPAVALGFSVRDTRGALAELFGRSHVAGDGGADDLAMPPDTRRKFVETALWKPALRTDASGKAKVRFELPDNLTEFRMMAVAIDKEGKGGARQASFTVAKPVLVEPVLPRFAHVGDQVEIAAMVHNNTDQPLDATVRIEGEASQVKVPARDHVRVAHTMQPKVSGRRRVSMAALDPAGVVLDAVEKDVPVAQAGVDMHPVLSGAFGGEQRIALAIPANVELEPGAMLTIRLGEDMWPELAERVEFLLGYPHGCVEQTTSSTLPLVAARDILPRIGASRRDDDFFYTRIAAGLARLASMKTASGGLGYWPGDPDPNVFGTAYAIRAFVRAKALGIDTHPDVLAGMTRFLADHVRHDGAPLGERAAIAQSLAELGALPPGILDTLFARRGEMDLFARASLALALGPSDVTRERVGVVLDEIEKALGEASLECRDIDYGHYGSTARTRAQVVMALTRFRRTSPHLPALVREIATSTEGYTTLATAWGLLAIADHLKGLGSTASSSSVTATLDGRELPVARTLASGREYEVPLAELVGKKAELVLHGGADQVIGFLVRAAYRQPIAADAGSLLSATAPNGPEVFRVYTRPDGSAVDLDKVAAGELLRVALLVRLPRGPDIKRGYLAITDRLPAGFEAVQPDLATVASAPELGASHPLKGLLDYPRSAASHVEMRDDRVLLYFDKVSDYFDDVAATYLVRVTTPGSFALPPAMAELMYQPDSLSYSESGAVHVQ
jgi:alpha-2-macroglobulin